MHACTHKSAYKCKTFEVSVTALPCEITIAYAIKIPINKHMYTYVINIHYLKKKQQFYKQKYNNNSNKLLNNSLYLSINQIYSYVPWLLKPFLSPWGHTCCRWCSTCTGYITVIATQYNLSLTVIYYTIHTLTSDALPFPVRSHLLPLV